MTIGDNNPTFHVFLAVLIYLHVQKFGFEDYIKAFKAVRRKKKFSRQVAWSSPSAIDEDLSRASLSRTLGQTLTPQL